MPNIYNIDKNLGGAGFGAVYSESGPGFGGTQEGASVRQVGGRAERVYSVSGVNRRLNGLLKSDPELQNVWVSGEVSNFRPHYSGHHYFTLKDSSSAIRCVMFRSAASRMRFKLENGQGVVILGSVSIYERDGQYQLYCEEIHADGVGDLYAAFEQMKNKLAGEGLFDQSQKKPIPPMPSAVCVITSPTGSVVKDIINVSTRRFPMAVIKVIPVQVQGAAAAPQIADAIEKTNSLGLADVIIVARGGGSLEDLWAFNEEAVARAVAASRIPVVSAVGHETDFTICDFASDLRAPTPSAAAELVFPEAEALKGRVAQARRLLGYALRKKSEQARRRLERSASGAALQNPARRAEFARMRLDGAETKLTAAMKTRKDRGAARLAVLAARLGALSPLSVLSRGYAIATDPQSGKAIKSAADAAIGQRVNVRLYEGELACEVTEKRGPPA